MKMTKEDLKEKFISMGVDFTNAVNDVTSAEGYFMDQHVDLTILAMTTQGIEHERAADPQKVVVACDKLIAMLQMHKQLAAEFLAEET